MENICCISGRRIGNIHTYDDASKPHSHIIGSVFNRKRQTLNNGEYNSRVRAARILKGELSDSLVGDELLFSVNERVLSQFQRIGIKQKLDVLHGVAPCSINKQQHPRILRHSLHNFDSNLSFDGDLRVESNKQQHGLLLDTRYRRRSRTSPQAQASLLQD
jgi:hypothetical protein